MFNLKRSLSQVVSCVASEARGPGFTLNVFSLLGFIVVGKNSEPVNLKLIDISPLKYTKCLSRLTFTIPYQSLQL